MRERENPGFSSQPEVYLRCIRSDSIVSKLRLGYLEINGQFFDFEVEDRASDSRLVNVEEEGLYL